MRILRSVQLTDATRHEDGAVAVVVALLLTVFVLMAALVIDLGLSRIDSGRDQLVADQAAAAGANQLDVLAEIWNAREACETALAYAESNLNLPAGATAVGGADCATQYGSVSQCTDATSLDPAVYELGRHRIVIQLPVADADPLMQDHGPLQDADFDGDPCERVGVEVVTDRDYLLAGVAGFEEGTTARGAVGRVTADGEDSTFASLIVLHPDECQVLVAQNQDTRIQVGSLTTIEDGEEVVYPGAITVYSQPAPGDCTSNNNKVIRASANSSRIEADGLLLSYGASRGAGNPGQIYQQNDFDAGRLTPRPRPGPPVTRSEIDHEYNCIDGYPTSGATWRPNRGGLPYTECEESTPAHVRDLHNAYQSLTPEAAAADGWTVFPDDFPGKECNSAELGVAEAGANDRWFINCPGSTGQNRFQPRGFTLEDVERVVLNGEIRMTSGDSALRISGPDEEGATVYVQSGDITRNSGPFILEDVFLYVDDGRLDLAGGSAQVTMTPPLGTTNCDAGYLVGEAPPPDCFRKMSLWSNRTGLGTSDINRMGGGATLFIQGILFSPNNAFEVSGSGDDEPLSCDPGDPVPSGQKVNLRNAQFWSSRVTVAGNGVVTLCPSPEFAQEVQIPGSSLIR